MLTTLLRAGGSSGGTPAAVDAVSGGMNRRRPVNLKFYQAPLSLLVMFLGG
jgi:hypothetical protein